MIEITDFNSREFLVKNCTFPENGTPITVSGQTLAPFTNIAEYAPQAPIDLSIVNDEYSFLFEEVSDSEGVSGQSTINPLSNFGDHMLVELPNGKFYDPSYGDHNPYIDDPDTEGLYLYVLDASTNTNVPYQTRNIDGYLRVIIMDIVEADYGDNGIDFNGNGTIEINPQMMEVWGLIPEPQTPTANLVFSYHSFYGIN